MGNGLTDDQETCFVWRQRFRTSRTHTYRSCPGVVALQLVPSPLDYKGLLCMQIIGPHAGGWGIPLSCKHKRHIITPLQLIPTTGLYVSVSTETLTYVVSTSWQVIGLQAAFEWMGKNCRSSLPGLQTTNIKQSHIYWVDQGCPNQALTLRLLCRPRCAHMCVWNCTCSSRGVSVV